MTCGPCHRHTSFSYRPSSWWLKLVSTLYHRPGWDFLQLLHHSSPCLCVTQFPLQYRVLVRCLFLYLAHILGHFDGVCSWTISHYQVNSRRGDSLTKSMWYGQVWHLWRNAQPWGSNRFHSLWFSLRTLPNIFFSVQLLLTTTPLLSRWYGVVHLLSTPNMSVKFWNVLLVESCLCVSAASLQSMAPIHWWAYLPQFQFCDLLWHKLQAA